MDRNWIKRIFRSPKNPIVVHSWIQRFRIPKIDFDDPASTLQLGSMKPGGGNQESAAASHRLVSCLDRGSGPRWRAWCFAPLEPCPILKADSPTTPSIQWFVAWLPWLDLRCFWAALNRWPSRFDGHSWVVNLGTVYLCIFHISLNIEWYQIQRSFIQFIPESLSARNFCWIPSPFHLGARDTLGGVASVATLGPLVELANVSAEDLTNSLVTWIWRGFERIRFWGHKI